MKMSRNDTRNSALVSIWEGPSQSCATDTNKDEKVPTPILNIEALKTISRIVRAIKARINVANGQHSQKDPATTAGDAGSRAPTCPVSGQDHDRTSEEK